MFARAFFVFNLAQVDNAHQPRPDHAAYLVHWLEVLKADAHAIFTAAAKAQQAAGWMWAQQPREADAGAG